MQVIDLTNEYKDLYFVCLEDRSDEIKEAGGIFKKGAWVKRCFRLPSATPKKEEPEAWPPGGCPCPSS